MTLALPARAKLNLDLQVVRRRDDGFHDLRTTFQAIALHDLVELEEAGTTQVTVTGFEVSPERNSVLDALRALEAAAGRSLPARIRLHKRIPPGSGMGGASSDAAATLMGLKAMYRLEVDLHQTAARVGADVPFFLTGGRARGEGRGELLVPLDFEPAWFAVAWPGIELSTAAVYRAWDDVKGEVPNELRRAAEHVEPRLDEFARELGAGWRMTGSGSAFFKQTETEEEAREAVAALETWNVVTPAVPGWA